MADDDAKFFAAKRAAHPRLFSIPGVRSVAIGHKVTGGINTRQVAIVVKVERKRQRAEIPTDELIPAEIDGIPTDVMEWSAEVYCIATVDDSKSYRPLLGGVRIAIDFPSGATGFGTMGFIGHTIANGAVVGVTCKHVVSFPPTPAGSLLSGVKVGQPTSSDSSSCCSDIFGTVHGGVEKTSTALVDAAMVLFKKNDKYFRDIVSMGQVAGVRPPLGTADLNTTKVFKRGQRTGQTSGVISGIDKSGTYGTPPVTLDLGIEITPDSATPIWDDCVEQGQCAGMTNFQAFACEGDSGAAVYDEQNMLVGLFRSLHCDGTAMATPIAVVTNELKIVVETATAAGQLQTAQAIPGVNAVSTDLERLTGPSGISPPQAELIQKVRNELIGTPLGRGMDIAVRRHQREVLDLVNGNRRVAAVWQRNGGPEIIRAVVDMAQRADARLPDEIDGEPFETRLNRIGRCLSRYGTEPLSTDLARYGPRLAVLGGLNYPQLLAAFHRAGD
jgi:hypothetical protein